MSTNRAHNFSAGPAALPLPVLERARDELVDFRGAGMSIMEMSHRGAIYDGVHEKAIADLHTLMGLGAEHRVLFMQGGARGQFAIVPMNLLSAGRTAGYVDTGRWSHFAIKEARKFGAVDVLYSDADDGYGSCPAAGELAVDPSLAYVHYTSNNTVVGSQFSYVPDVGDVPLVCDMSSDILSRPAPFGRFGLIYAGAQKNLGPAGVTLVVVREDLLERSREELPEVFHYAKMAAKSSMLNTPPTFGIYLLGLVVQHLLDLGGLEAMAERNGHKAELIYRAIDSSAGFYRGATDVSCRSQMNVTWRIETEALEKQFVAEATEAGLVGLKGHRAVGGLRASIYNAVSLESVRVLVDFMQEFKRTRG